MGQKKQPGSGTDPAKKVPTPKPKPGGDAHSPREEKAPIALPPKIRILVTRMPGNLEKGHANGPVAGFAYKVGTKGEIPKGTKEKKAGDDGTFEIRLPDDGIRIGVFGTEYQVFTINPGRDDPESAAWTKLAFLGYHDTEEGTTQPIDILRFQLDNGLATTGLLDKPTREKIDATYTDRESKKFPTSK